ncbi:hypothetical protein ACHAXR_013047 [Thalassiosira sp. AJA248-18]
MSNNAPPPSASAFLLKHTHHSDNVDDEATSSVSVGATEIVSNLIEGLVGGGSTSPGEDDTSSVSSMKHRKENSGSYRERLPKTYGNDSDDGGANPVPYRGFGKAPADTTSSAPVRTAPFAGLRYRLRGFFSPRATDIQQLLIKLQAQFQMLEIDHETYALKRDGSVWDEGEQHKNNANKDSMKDPNHPLNNPSLMTEVHFVGRKAIDSSIIELSTILTNQDKFGSITELWLNNNLISDDGAAAIASFLQLPHCALIELWLGNNQIGPSGTTLISAALSNNENSQLKCLGLYLNPIGNGGASTLAQMLRKNHTLSTVDIHGCGMRGKGGHEVLEGYGCKVVVARDGTEYVARVVAPNSENSEGYVTDQRLLDSIQTFVAFNRINPTREQVIRGMMSSNKHIQDDTNDEEGDDSNDHRTNVSEFLSKLCNKPANEQLTDEEKRTWKDCEWERLHVELERARAAKSALANTLEAHAEETKPDGEEEADVDEEEGNMEPLVESGNIVQEKEEETIVQGLDDEVVRTDTKSWRDLKMGITGSTKAKPRERKAPPETPAKEQEFFTISQVETETDPPPPQSTFV